MIRRLLILSLAACGLASAQSPYPGRLPLASDPVSLMAVDDTEGVLDVPGLSTKGPSFRMSSWRGTWVPNMAVTIDGEIIRICGVDLPTITVCAGGRGLDIYGLATLSHSQHTRGALVKANIIAAHHNTLKDLLLDVTTALGPRLQNVLVLSGMPSAMPGQVLTWNGTRWTPQTVNGGSAGGVSTFNGRAGAVQPAASDYSFAMLSGVASIAQLPPVVGYLANVTSDIQAQLNSKIGGGVQIPISTLAAGDYSSRITSGTYAINISGTAAQVPWQGVTGKPSIPTDLSQLTDDTGRLTSGAGTVNPNSLVQGDYSAKLTGPGVYPISISGNAATAAFATAAGSVAWSAVSGRPTGLLAFTNDAGYLTSAGVADWNTLLHKPTIPTEVSNLGKTGISVSYWPNDAGYLTSVPAQTWVSITGKPTIPTLTSQLTNDSGFVTSISAQTWASITGKPTVVSYWTNDAGYLTSAGTISNATTVGGYTPARISNAYSHDASWTWQDNNTALPIGLAAIQQGVFAARSAAATITSVQCWADTNDAVMQLRRSDGAYDLITGNITCTMAGAYTASLTANTTVSPGQFLGMYLISGTAQRVNVVVSYTTAY